MIMFVKYIIHCFSLSQQIICEPSFSLLFLNLLRLLEW